MTNERRSNSVWAGTGGRAIVLAGGGDGTRPGGGVGARWIGRGGGGIDVDAAGLGLL